MPAKAITLAVLLISPAASAGAAELRPASDFSAIADQDERAAALFTEAGKVLRHPRCVNCHPAGDSPLQGDRCELHQPPVHRGRGGAGPVGMRCRTCHQRENFDAGRVPGAEQWLLAPSRMAWEGLEVGEICEQVKDPERNGGRSLKEIVEHMSEDHLVGWGWHPGAGREPVPGTWEEFGELIRAWAKAGAACP